MNRDLDVKMISVCECLMGINGVTLVTVLVWMPSQTKQKIG
jgi:hypothetical protein